MHAKGFVWIFRCEGPQLPFLLLLSPLNLVFKVLEVVILLHRIHYSPLSVPLFTCRCSHEVLKEEARLVIRQRWQFLWHCLAHALFKVVRVWCRGRHSVSKLHHFRCCLITIACHLVTKVVLLCLIRCCHRSWPCCLTSTLSHQQLVDAFLIDKLKATGLFTHLDRCQLSAEQLEKLIDLSNPLFFRCQVLPFNEDGQVFQAPLLQVVLHEEFNLGVACYHLTVPLLSVDQICLP